MQNVSGKAYREVGSVPEERLVWSPSKEAVASHPEHPSAAIGDSSPQSSPQGSGHSSRSTARTVPEAQAVAGQADVGALPQPPADDGAGEPVARSTPGPEPDARRTNPSLAEVKEIGGPTGPEPTRFGDWEKKGRCIDF